MSHLQIRFSMDNAAFEQDWRDESARILRAAARAIVLAKVDCEAVLYDINGNDVGVLLIEPPEGDGE